MKNKFKYILLAMMAVVCFSCSEDEPSSESIIVVDEKVKNEFDNWLTKNYVYPYNIDFKYRMEDIESDLNYTLVPAEFDKSVKLAKLVKYLCLEAYDEVAGVDFMRSYFPKMIHLVGSPAYRSNGTMVLGTAEGGLKITLYNVNNVNTSNIDDLNYFYFKTIHHEFSHILNQTKNYPTDFADISGADYISDSWNSLTDAQALAKGFISPYASSEASEDFVELIAIYITHDATYWSTMLTSAGTVGAPIINQKFEIVYNYMLNSWGIDLNELRSVVQRRSGEIGNLDLDNLN